VRWWRALAVLPIALALGACSVPRTIATEVACDTQNRAREILITQAVPSATLIPCIRELSPGWSYSGSDVRSGRATFWLDSDRAGVHAVEVVLTERCDVDGLEPSATRGGEIGVERYVRSVSLHPYEVDEMFLFPGGCVTYRDRFGSAEQAPTLAAQVDRSLTFLSRPDFVKGVAEGMDGAILCGAGAPPCVGS
jgi:hypothetical protein